MNNVFEYAENQVLGLRFESFSYKDASGTYVWRGGLIGSVCACLMDAGLAAIAEVIFNRFLRGV